MASPASVFLARHGQTAYNLEGRFQGQLPVPLDDTGRAQAAELAGRAAAHDFVTLRCSPLLRARETADVVAARIGLDPREDPRLMETDAGDWTDRSFADVQAEAPDAFAAFLGGEPDFAFPGGESFAQQGIRVAAALADVEEGALPALVVCHGGVIRIALFQRAGRAVAMGQRVPNGALVPLVPFDPAAVDRADVGGDAAPQPS
ncbi:MAG TPA: histidine phosphatase family protein [Solirubrobacteraceae bacterium]|nr:histidine phosphatase family protein [Solirubrobacteraceae bacterium]